MAFTLSLYDDWSWTDDINCYHSIPQKTGSESVVHFVKCLHCIVASDSQTALIYFSSY